jgi:hypothetical protein
MQNRLNNTDLPAEEKRALSGEERLRKAISARDRFLAGHPHLQPYQKEIDRLLDGSGNSQGRMAVLGTMMQGKLLEMQKELNTLTKILQKAATDKSQAT